MLPLIGNKFSASAMTRSFLRTLRLFTISLRRPYNNLSSSISCSSSHFYDYTHGQRSRICFLVFSGQQSNTYHHFILWSLSHYLFQPRHFPTACFTLFIVYLLDSKSVWSVCRLAAVPMPVSLSIPTRDPILQSCLKYTSLSYRCPSTW